MDFSELEMRVSRTEQKKAHARLQQLANPLAGLSKKQLKQLPVSEYFMAELQHLAAISAAAARNRQIKRVGKLMVEEDRHTLIKALFELKFPPEKATKVLGWLDRLNLTDAVTLKQFCKQFQAAEHNTLYQLLLWVAYAKHLDDDELLAESNQDLRTYLYEVALLSE